MIPPPESSIRVCIHPSLLAVWFAEVGMKNAPRYLRCGWGKSTQAGIRTQDQLVKSQLLYQLSYLRVGFGVTG